MKSEYDRFAGDFSQTRNRTWPEFELLHPLMHKQDRILDIGCGNARLRDWTDLRDGHYFGFDISEDLLSIARKKYPKDHFFRGSMVHLPFGDDNFEGVTAIASFHHLLSKRDQQSCLAEIYRVLKPGGYVFITTWMLPRKYFWSNILRGRFLNWNIPFGKEKHPRTYRWVRKNALKRLCKQVGFDVSHCDYFQGRNLVMIAKKPV